MHIVQNYIVLVYRFLRIFKKAMHLTLEADDPLRIDGGIEMKRLESAAPQRKMMKDEVDYSEMIIRQRCGEARQETSWQGLSNHIDIFGAAFCKQVHT